MQILYWNIEARLSKVESMYRMLSSYRWEVGELI